MTFVMNKGKISLVLKFFYTLATCLVGDVFHQKLCFLLVGISEVTSRLTTLRAKVDTVSSAPSFYVS